MTSTLSHEPRFQLANAETWANPWPMYRALRDHDPVHHVVPTHRPEDDYYVLTRHADVWAAARDHETFSSAKGLTLVSGATSFPNHFVGDLVETDRGWVVVPPTCCPDSHPTSDPGWSVSAVWCSCNGRHLRWLCWCGKSIYAPQPGADCRMRDRGPVSMFEQDQRRQARDGGAVENR